MTNRGVETKTGRARATGLKVAFRRPDQAGTASSSMVWGVAAAALLLGAGGMWFYLRTLSVPAPQAALPASRVSIPAAAAGPAEVSVIVPPDAMKGVVLKVDPVIERALVSQVRSPGNVQSHGYREVRVSPLAGGLVSRMDVQLGDWVKKGQTLATISSSDLANAQMEYLTMKAELDAEHKKLQRTRELSEIGAASRQEVEGVEATHAVHMAHVEAAAQRLVLLGLGREQISSLTEASQVMLSLTVSSPIAGIVVSRAANQGQVVSAGQDLLTVSDLSRVWIIGDIFERDFPHVRIGSSAVIRTPAYPAKTYRGRVSYIDPQVDPQTRTAKARVEVENPGLLLRIGMYTDISFEQPSGTSVPSIPRAAVQALGSRTVVYLPSEEEGVFLQRPVHIGEAIEGYVRVLDGLKPGERVVTEGSFFLRAESLRQHPAQ